MTTLLSLEDLVAGWEQPVLGPFSGTVARGEVVGLSGPNGAGKSTVLAAIAGAARVFSGQVQLASGCRLAYQTQQQPPLQGLPLTGRELLALTDSEPAGLPPWLADKLDRRLDRLSGGQRQFLALWAVLNSPADLILLDEPSNNLDVAGSRFLATAIRQRAARGAGMLVVSHEAELLASACDRQLSLTVEMGDLPG